MSEQRKLKDKKIDTKEFIEVLTSLPEEEKFKIFYMVKGMELRSENNEPVA